MNETQKQIKAGANMVGGRPVNRPRVQRTAVGHNESPSLAGLRLAEMRAGQGKYIGGFVPSGQSALRAKALILDEIRDENVRQTPEFVATMQLLDGLAAGTIPAGDEARVRFRELVALLPKGIKESELEAEREKAVPASMVGGVGKGQVTPRLTIDAGRQDGKLMIVKKNLDRPQEVSQQPYHSIMEVMANLRAQRPALTADQLKLCQDRLGRNQRAVFHLTTTGWVQGSGQPPVKAQAGDKE
jgi:hypothetical protein